MMKFSALLLTACYLLLSSCVHSAPGFVEEDSAPQGGGKWGKIIEKKDGHYNVTLSQISNTCEEKNSIITDDWDVIDLGQGLMKIKFSNNDWSFWTDIDVEIGEDGKFSSAVAAKPFPWIAGGYASYQMEFKNGLIADNNFFADITYKYLEGADENVKVSCERKYRAVGFRRFAAKQSAGKTTEGEYSARLIVKKNTCGAIKELPRVFILDAVPQKNGLYNFLMWSFHIADLDISPDGTFDVLVAGDNSYAITYGKLTPDSIYFKLYIQYGLYACEQDLEISGEKRFEESNGYDGIIDGVYSVVTNLIINTCDNRPPIARFHLDAIGIDAVSIRLVLGNKDFMAKLDGIKFSGSYSEGMIKNKFNGSITPNEIDGKLAIDVHELNIINLTERNCSFLYKINGYKLYKHN